VSITAQSLDSLFLKYLWLWPRLAIAGIPSVSVTDITANIAGETNSGSTNAAGDSAKPILFGNKLGA
jgi:hypothetical protein